MMVRQHSGDPPRDYRDRASGGELLGVVDQGEDGFRKASGVNSRSSQNHARPGVPRGLAIERLVIGGGVGSGTRMLGFPRAHSETSSRPRARPRGPQLRTLNRSGSKNPRTTTRRVVRAARSDPHAPSPCPRADSRRRARRAAHRAIVSFNARAPWLPPNTSTGPPLRAQSECGARRARIDVLWCSDRIRTRRLASWELGDNRSRASGNPRCTWRARRVSQRCVSPGTRSALAGRSDARVLRAPTRPARRVSARADDDCGLLVAQHLSGRTPGSNGNHRPAQVAPPLAPIDRSSAANEIETDGAGGSGLHAALGSYQHNFVA